MAALLVAAWVATAMLSRPDGAGFYRPGEEVAPDSLGGHFERWLDLGLLAPRGTPLAAEAAPGAMSPNETARQVEGLLQENATLRAAVNLQGQAAGDADALRAAADALKARNDLLADAVEAVLKAKDDALKGLPKDALKRLARAKGIDPVPDTEDAIVAALRGREAAA